MHRARRSSGATANGSRLGGLLGLLLLAGASACSAGVASPTPVAQVTAAAPAPQAPPAPAEPSEATRPLLFAPASELPADLLGLRVERLSGADDLPPHAQDFIAAANYCGGPRLSWAIDASRSPLAQALLEHWLRAPERLVEWVRCGREVRRVNGWTRHTLSFAGTEESGLVHFSLLAPRAHATPAFFVAGPPSKGLRDVRCVPNAQGTCDPMGFAMATIERFDRVAVGPLDLIASAADGPRLAPERAALLEGLARDLDASPGDRWLWFPSALWIGPMGLSGVRSKETEAAAVDLLRLALREDAALACRLGADYLGPASMQVRAPTEAGATELAAALERMRAAYAAGTPEPVPQNDVQGRFTARMQEAYRRALEDAEVERQGEGVRLDFTPALTREVDRYRDRRPRIAALARVFESLEAGRAPAQEDLAAAVDDTFAKRVTAPLPPLPSDAGVASPVPGLDVPAGGTVHGTAKLARTIYDARAGERASVLLRLLAARGWTLGACSIGSAWATCEVTQGPRALSISMEVTATGRLTLEAREVVRPPRSAPPASARLTPAPARP